VVHERSITLTAPLSDAGAGVGRLGWREVVGGRPVWGTHVFVRWSNHGSLESETTDETVAATLFDRHDLFFLFGCDGSDDGTHGHHDFEHSTKADKAEAPQPARVWTSVSFECLTRIVSSMS
jgi:hypothetical protein